ncbi:MAG: hypothetical protein QG623_458 [Patescibacteria group bacterium]|nr:hypothetical protein [Patescibacteria group bacterium]
MLMFGRDSRTLSKLFESMVHSPLEYSGVLSKAKEVIATEQRKFIVGLRY